MADKTIGELPAISALSASAMLPVEQNGVAGRVSGAQWAQYAIDSVSPEAAAAEYAAANAANSATLASEKATLAGNSATLAAASAASAESDREKIENMTVSATTLSAGASATVNKTTSGGVAHLTFGIPRGATGAQGIQGPQGPQGVQGPKGDTGSAVAVETEGMYYFSVDNDSNSPTFGHLFLTYTGDSAPNFSINENGHLIWTVE